METAEALPIIKAMKLTIRSPQFTGNKDYTFISVLDGRLKTSKSAEQMPDSSADELFARYNAGDVFSVSPEGGLYLSGDPAASVLLLKLKPEFLCDRLNNGIIFCDSSVEPEKNYFEIRRLISEICSRYKDPAACEPLSVTGLTYLLLSELRKFQQKLPADPDISERSRSRAREVDAYIDRHFAEPLTLTQISGAFYLTPQYFSAFMKTAFRQNFKTYLTQKRLFYAGRDLRNTSLSVMEISLKNGFGSVSAFRKHFSDFYHMSPLDYRKKYLTASAPSHPDSATAADNIRASLDSAGITASAALLQKIEVSASDGTAQIKNISTAINVGAAENLLRDRFRRMLLALHEEIHFTHIRMQEFISTGFIPMVLPNYAYYFQKADAVLSFLSGCGLAPWIELARMPIRPDSSSDSETTLFYVRRDKRFFDLLGSFLKHVSGRWPGSWTRKWRFELWMSPRDTVSVYIRDFQAVKKLINEYLPGASVGGPGLKPVLSSSEQHKKPDSSQNHPMLNDILDAFQKAGVRPDFFSVYLNYSTEEELPHSNPAVSRETENAKSTGGISPDPAYIEKTAASTAEVLHRLLPGTPLSVSEWCSADIRNLPVAASRYQAAFIGRTLLHIAPYCDTAAYWLLSDEPHSSGMLRPPEFYSFGQGLLNREGLPTAAYFAYVLFRRLTGTIISQGENYCITRSNSTHCQIFAFHYTHFAPFVHIENAGDFAFDRVYDLFTESPEHAIRFTLHGLEPGIYLISRIFINLQRGSILDIMIGEYSHSNLGRIDFLQKTKSPSREELLFRSSACIPEERRVFLKSDGTLTLESDFSAHDVCLWDIRRQV